MIDKDRIFLAPISHRLEGLHEIPRPLNIPSDLNGEKLMLWRIEEIDFTNDYGKAFLTEHHLKEALCTINYFISEFTPSIIKPLRDARSAFKTMSDNFIEVLEPRVIPALKGLSYFTTPPEIPNVKYQKICYEYGRKVQAVKEMNAQGKGRFKNGCDQLSPHFNKLLNDLKEFLEEVLKDYFNYVPDKK
jgi:hypothetical protein